MHELKFNDKKLSDVSLHVPVEKAQLVVRKKLFRACQEIEGVLDPDWEKVLFDHFEE
jgi:hypothetical protein